jgi:hypothetical protein
MKILGKLRQETKEAAIPDHREALRSAVKEEPRHICAPPYFASWRNVRPHPLAIYSNSTAKVCDKWSKLFMAPIDTVHGTLDLFEFRASVRDDKKRE